MPIYIYKKSTQEDPYYFDKELPSENNNSNKKIEDNKIDEENKKNILENKLFKALTNNKTIQISPVQKEKKIQLD